MRAARELHELLGGCYGRLISSHRDLRAAQTQSKPQTVSSQRLDSRSTFGHAQLRPDQRSHFPFDGLPLGLGIVLGHRSLTTRARVAVLHDIALRLIDEPPAIPKDLGQFTARGH